MSHMRATVAPRNDQASINELTDERSGNRVRVASWEYEPDVGRASVFAGPYNVDRLSGGEAPASLRAERRAACRN